MSWERYSLKVVWVHPRTGQDNQEAERLLLPVVHVHLPDAQTLENAPDHDEHFSGSRGRQGLEEGSDLVRIPLRLGW